MDNPARRELLRFAAIAAILVVVALLADHLAYQYLVLDDVYEEDWGRMLRVMGYVPLWMLAATALALHDRGMAALPGRPDRDRGAVTPGGSEQARPNPHTIRPRAWLARGSFLLGSVLAAGVTGELLKLVFRRERPRAHEGLYYFRPWSDRPLHNGGLALPSTHTVVAFGAAAALARLFPRAAPVFYLLAAGCGLTRVLTQAHFLSDVVVAALVAWLVVALVWRRWGGRIQLSSPHVQSFRE